MKPNFSQLAKEIGLNRHIISKKYYGKEVFKPRERKSQLDPYKEEIRDMLSDPTILISSAYFYFTDEERNEKKITCTLSNFTKYVKKHRLNQKITNHIAHPKFETDPGKQMQVDWVEDLSLVTIDGEILNFNLFSATLGYSRMHYFEYAPSKTKDDFMKYLLRSFKYFGGKLMKY